MSRNLVWVFFAFSVSGLGLLPAPQVGISGIGPLEPPVRLYTGFSFTEGPTADAEGNIYFTDLPRSRIHKIDAQGQLSTFLENTQRCNGLKFDGRQRLIACQRDTGRVIGINVNTKTIEVIASQYNNQPLGAPNDLVVDKNGGVYFTSGSVYYVAVGGQVTRLITNLTGPNGIILSPDEKTLYLLHMQPNVMAYPVTGTGQLGAGRIFATLQATGGGDGLTVDTQGNLYVTRPSLNALEVVTSSGVSLGLIQFPEATNNCTFAGADMKTLYVAARGSLYTANMEATGHRFAHIASDIFYPRLVTAVGLNTGIAVANLDAIAAIFRFTAFDRTGTQITGAKITNPISKTLKRGEQIPIVDSQLFGSGLTGLNPIGWFRLESTVSKIAGFFLTFDDNLSVLDGADVSSKSLTSFVLPEVEGQGFTQIHIANPDLNPATITFELLKSDGTNRASSVTRTVNSNGAVAEFFTDLFPNVPAGSSDYLRVTSNRGVAPFEYLGKTGVYVGGLNGQDALSGATTLYCPQYVVGGSPALYRTTLSVINLDSIVGTVTFRLIKDDGTQTGATQTRSIAARGKIYITDQKFFLDPGNTLTQGYVIVTSSGPKLTGSVVFGDPARNSFSSALPMVSTLQTSIVFCHVASNATYFTGLALLNPNSIDSNALIELFDKEGSLIGSKTELIRSNRRLSLLLTQYFPGLTGADISSGYIKVTVDKAVASFALFGTKNLSVLAAIPAQVPP